MERRMKTNKSEERKGGWRGKWWVNKNGRNEGYVSN
jgi:hypothetical protein